jgi:hypothetical protein
MRRILAISLQLQALGSGFWVLGSGFWVLGFGFWVQDSITESIIVGVAALSPPWKKGDLGGLQKVI